MGEVVVLAYFVGLGGVSGWVVEYVTYYVNVLSFKVQNWQKKLDNLGIEPRTFPMLRGNHTTTTAVSG